MTSIFLSSAFQLTQQRPCNPNSPHEKIPIFSPRNLRMQRPNNNLLFQDKLFISKLTPSQTHNKIMANYHATTSTATSIAPSTMGSQQASSETIQTEAKGIGINKFLRGKNYFITGATGFLGKALVEKILRTDADKIFVLVKAKTYEEAVYRLKSEIIDSELLDSLRKMHGKSYEAFMLSKLIPVVGNICENGLGMDEAYAQKISEEVNIIINSAGNTTFDERYDSSLITNTKGPSEITRFANKCKNLVVLLHVSTTYVNGEREGIIMEKSFEMGQTIAREKTTNAPDNSMILDVNAEMELALRNVNETPKKLRELGMERAKYFGWKNTYELSKAMGEMEVNAARGDIPVVILRPSVITSSYKYPFPGWVQGLKVQDPLIISYGQNKLPCFFGLPGVVLDVIPVDMVVNAILGAIAKHGSGNIKNGLIIYQVGSSTINPLRLDDMFRYSYNHFVSSPFLDQQGERINISELKFLDTIKKVSNYTWSEIIKNHESINTLIAGNSPKNEADMSRMLERRYKKIVDCVLQMHRLYEPYTFYEGRFDNGNTQKLVEAMSIDELESFDCDVRGIDWEDYFCNIHVPGLRKHVIKGRGG